MKSWWKILSGKGRQTQESDASTLVARTKKIPIDVQPDEPPRALEDCFIVAEVSEADFFVGSLFRRRFGCDSFPDTPKHFVAFFKQRDGSVLPLGYVHFEMWQQHALGGGLVIDEQVWRRLPAQERILLRQNGGVAEMLLRTALGMLPADLIGIWGYVGDKQAEKVDLRVGFCHTTADKVMVIWRNDPGEAEKSRWLQKVVELGPF